MSPTIFGFIQIRKEVSDGALGFPTPQKRTTSTTAIAVGLQDSLYVLQTAVLVL